MWVGRVVPGTIHMDLGLETAGGGKSARARREMGFPTARHDDRADVRRGRPTGECNAQPRAGLRKVQRKKSGTGGDAVVLLGTGQGRGTARGGGARENVEIEDGMMCCGGQ